MSRVLLLVASFMSASGIASAQVNTSVTDGTRRPAEGVLHGYTVQVGGQTLCSDPIAWGRYIACSGRSTHRVWVETNGMLGAYVVIDAQGREVCRDPMVWNQFRGTGSFIVCE